jgi:hypothetical protein
MTSDHKRDCQEKKPQQIYGNVCEQNKIIRHRSVTIDAGRLTSGRRIPQA